MSIMSLSAIAMYGLVMLACLAAAYIARNYPDRPFDTIHWLGSGVIFIGLAIMRMVDGEDRIRDLARSLTRNSGDYADRTILQVPLAIGVLVLIIGLGWYFARKWRSSRRGSRERLVLMARLGLASLLPLYALRLVSLHQTDWLLYNGPLRLNWVLEGGICLLVGGSAALYAWTKRPRVQPRPNTRR